MLTRLSVRNVVLIDRLDLDFSPGLTVLTGETGAGKSILLDALSLALGMRADSGLVRAGTREAAVTACFAISLTHPAANLLAEHGLPAGEELIIRRTLTADGRSRAFVNDEAVSISFLKSLGDTLVEVHGQFASHRLLNPATHLGTLDAYGDLASAADTCRRAYADWQYRRTERDRAEQQLLQAQKEEAFLRDSVQALDRLNPAPDEEETLTARRTRLMNSEKIITALGAATTLLSDEDTGAATRLSAALAELEHADTWAEGALAEPVARLTEALALVDDAAAVLDRAGESWGDASELPAIDDRLFALRDMARKHQVTIAELPALRDRLTAQLAQLENGADSLKALQDMEETAKAAYRDAATRLSDARHQAAKRLDEAVARELPALKLNKATFRTQITPLAEDSWTAAGWDAVVFLVATNPGTPPAPIHKVVSGGELARFMLALKVNLAAADATETLIFDEVDTGIGGATAAAVGARLKRLASDCQVLTVTHAPQVAAYGDTHLTVMKEATPDGVITRVRQLAGDDRTDEVARMLSGESVTETARTMAVELIKTGAA